MKGPLFLDLRKYWEYVDCNLHTPLQLIALLGEAVCSNSVGRCFDSLEVTVRPKLDLNHKKNDP